MPSQSPITISGHLLIPDGAAAVRLSPGTVIVEGDRIADIRLGSFHPHPDFGGEGSIITPGFVDTHLHLPQFDSIGVDGLELLDWLNQAIFPAEKKWADRDYAAAMSRRVASELLSFGTTSVAAYATSHHESAQVAIDVLAQAGLSGHVGQVLMDQNAPTELLVPASAALSQASSLRPRGRISPAVTPRFAVSCTRALMEGAARLAAKTGWLIQTHLAETQRECEVVRGLHPGDSYSHVYLAAGLLTPRCILGHGIWLSDAELAVLRDSRAVIAHCPTANRFLDAGAMNRSRALAAEVRVCLGTDIGAGPDRSMVRVARAVIDTAKQTAAGSRTGFPSAAECWHQITAGNAAAIGLADTGSLARGLYADLLVIDPPPASWRNWLDTLSTLLYSWDDRWLRHTFAAGRPAFSAV